MKRKTIQKISLIHYLILPKAFESIHTINARGRNPTTIKEKASPVY